MNRLFSLLLTTCLVMSLGACSRTEQITDEVELVPTVEAEPAPMPAPPEPTLEELAARRVDELLASLTLEGKIGQLFFVRCPAENAVEDIGTYHLGGYILFGRDFKDASGNWLTKEQVVQNITGYQAAAAADTGIPLLIGSDEEGGSVTRASRNPNLFDSKFKSPQWLWKNQHDHGNIFAEDAWEKSNALLSLGINVNLAPVCDVSSDPADFIYARTLGQDAQTTASFVETTVSAMRSANMGSVLKHFPGYGNNIDTHTGIALDQRTYSTFLRQDFLPFSAGIAAGGNTTAVLVSHNIVMSMDPDLPASLSSKVHNLLRSELKFEGVTMTDDLAMEAVESYAKDGSVAVMAIEAGNDLLITGDYHTQIPLVIQAVEEGILAEETIDTACRRVLTWKQNLGLIS
jgi:beta-N-acetylhexosaminidase